MSIGIYIIKNKINNKVYIGKAINIKKRWKYGHINYLNKNKHNNNQLQRSWDKYGENNFEFNIKEECEKELLNEREIYWINYYKSNNPLYGYNKTNGGDGGHGPTTEETKQKLRQYSGQNHFFYGKHHTDEAKQKISIAGKGNSHKTKGVSLSEEHKQAISKANKGKIRSKETKEKLREINTGKVISEEQRKKISNTLKGRKHPIDQIRKTADKNAKLTMQQAKQILILLDNNENKINIIEKFNISKRIIDGIRRTRKYRNIDLDNLEVF